jgi:hypothetical protein
VFLALQFMKDLIASVLVAHEKLFRVVTNFLTLYLFLLTFLGHGTG